jgi:hypothetical protein
VEGSGDAKRFFLGKKHGLAEAVRPAELLILAIDLRGGLLMSYGQFDVFYLIRSNGLDYLVYIL